MAATLTVPSSSSVSAEHHEVDEPGGRVSAPCVGSGAPLNVIRGEVVVCLSMLFAPEPEIYNMI